MRLRGVSSPNRVELEVNLGTFGIVVLLDGNVGLASSSVTFRWVLGYRVGISATDGNLDSLRGDPESESQTLLRISYRQRTGGRVWGDCGTVV